MALVYENKTITCGICNVSRQSSIKVSVSCEYQTSGISSVHYLLNQAMLFNYLLYFPSIFGKMVLRSTCFVFCLTNLVFKAYKEDFMVEYKNLSCLKSKAIPWSYFIYTCFLQSQRAAVIGVKRLSYEPNRKIWGYHFYTSLCLVYWCSGFTCTVIYVLFVWQNWLFLVLLVQLLRYFVVPGMQGLHAFHPPAATAETSNGCKAVVLPNTFST